MAVYFVEYMSAVGRARSVRVEASSVEAAMDAAVEAVGCNFSDIQSVEERGA